MRRVWGCYKLGLRVVQHYQHSGAGRFKVLDTTALDSTKNMGLLALLCSLGFDFWALLLGLRQVALQNILAGDAVYGSLYRNVWDWYVYF